MRFALTEEQTELQDLVRDVLDRECPPSVVRTVWSSGEPAGPRAAWKALAEIGAIGLLVPEQSGGLGLDETYLVPVLDATGYAALPGPLVETAAVAAPLLGDVELVERVVAGEVTIAVDTGDGLVAHGADADLIVRWGRAGGSPLEVILAGNVDAMPQAVVDRARPVARICGGNGWCVDDEALVELSWLRGVLGTAAQLIGLARRMLRMTVTYVREREQFGVPVGSFQAIKHKLADALLAMEFAAPAVYRAGWSLAHRDPDARCHVSMAKALASDAAVAVARTAIQCHGGIGYTVEYDLHMYAKRTWALASAWGSASWHRRVVADLLMPTTSEEVAR